MRGAAEIPEFSSEVTEEYAAAAGPGLDEGERRSGPPARVLDGAAALGGANWNGVRGTQAKETVDRRRSLRTVKTPARAVPVRANAPGSATFRGGVHLGSGPAHRK